jgi:hypothetical protein
MDANRAAVEEALNARRGAVFDERPRRVHVDAAVLRVRHACAAEHGREMVDGVNPRHGLSYRLDVANVSHYDVRAEASEILCLTVLADERPHFAPAGAQVPDESVAGVPPGSCDEYSLRITHGWDDGSTMRREAVSAITPSPA